MVRFRKRLDQIKSHEQKYKPCLYKHFVLQLASGKFPFEEEARSLGQERSKVGWHLIYEKVVFQSLKGRVVDLKGMV